MTSQEVAVRMGYEDRYDIRYAAPWLRGYEGTRVRTEAVESITEAEVSPEPPYYLSRTLVSYISYQSSYISYYTSRSMC